MLFTMIKYRFIDKPKVKIAAYFLLTLLILSLFYQYKYRNDEVKILNTRKVAFPRTVENYICANILNGNESMLRFYRSIHAPLFPQMPSSYYENLATDKELCASYKYKYYYTIDYYSITESELNFPIAFGFAIHKDVDRFARLLRILYRPHNIYVIHVDKKSSKEFKTAVKGIQMCLGERNIHILTGRYQIDVRWGCITSLQCYLNSMQYLIDKNITDWKYFLNLSGQEFPMRTNYELVQILKTLQNRNHIELHRGYVDSISRFPRARGSLRNVTFFKGFVYVMVTKEFCEFALRSEAARRVYDALVAHNRADCYLSDEVYFQTLQFNPHLGTPGGCRLDESVPPPDVRAKYRRMYSVWNRTECHSRKHRRGVCIFGVDDLPHLMKEHSYVIANKFHSDFQPVAYDCMEVELAKRMENQQRNHPTIKDVFVDLKPYQDHSLCL